MLIMNGMTINADFASWQVQQWNNGKMHVIGDYPKDEAIHKAKALHHPDWPCWIYLVVVGPDDKQVYSTKTN